MQDSARRAEPAVQLHRHVPVVGAQTHRQTTSLAFVADDQRSDFDALRALADCIQIVDATLVDARLSDQEVQLLGRPIVLRRGDRRGHGLGIELPIGFALGVDLQKYVGFDGDEPADDQAAFQQR